MFPTKLAVTGAVEILRPPLAGAAEIVRPSLIGATEIGDPKQQGHRKYKVLPANGKCLKLYKRALSVGAWQ